MEHGQKIKKVKIDMMYLLRYRNWNFAKQYLGEWKPPVELFLINDLIFYKGIKYCKYHKWSAALNI